jgi:hypothetical protein
MDGDTGKFVFLENRIVNGQWAMGSGQWAVGSGQKIGRRKISHYFQNSRTHSRFTIHDSRFTIDD